MCFSAGAILMFASVGTVQAQQCGDVSNDVFAYFKRGTNSPSTWKSEVGGYEAIGSGSVTVSGQTTSFTHGKYNTGFTVGELRGSGQGYTVGAWAKFTGSGGGWPSAVVGGEDPDGTEFFIGKTDGKACWGHQDGGFKSDFSCDSGFFDGQYHSVVFTSAADKTAKIYIDGILKGTHQMSGGRAQVDKETVLIGFEDDLPVGHDFPWIGNIDEVTFHSRELSQCEATEMHNLLLAGSPLVTTITVTNTVTTTLTTPMLFASSAHTNAISLCLALVLAPTLAIN